MKLKYLMDLVSHGNNIVVSACDIGSGKTQDEFLLYKIIDEKILARYGDYFVSEMYPNENEYGITFAIDVDYNSL